MTTTATTATVTTSKGWDLAVDACFASCDGVVYFLTPCCNASAKGSERGVICRACYRVVDDRMGMAWLAESFVAEYPAWCTSQGLTEGESLTFTRYAQIIASELGLGA